MTASVDVVDNDQAPSASGQRPERCAGRQQVATIQQPSRVLFGRAGVMEQLRPDQAPRLPADRRGAEHLESPVTGHLSGRRDERGLARSPRSHQGQDPAGSSRRRLEERIDFTDLGHTPDGPHVPECTQPAGAFPQAQRLRIWPVSTNVMKTAIMIAAAAVITRAVWTR